MEGFNEEKMGRQQKKEVLQRNMGKRRLRGTGFGARGNPVGLSIHDGPMEIVEHIWVNIWCILDRVSSQNCRNTLPLHTVGQLVRSAKNETLLWLAGLKCVKIRTHCKT